MGLILALIGLASTAPACAVEDASSGPVPCVHDGTVLNMTHTDWWELPTMTHHTEGE